MVKQMLVFCLGLAAVFSVLLLWSKVKEEPYTVQPPAKTTSKKPVQAPTRPAINEQPGASLPTLKQPRPAKIRSAIKEDGVAPRTLGDGDNDPKLIGKMRHANRQLDRNDHEGALRTALEILRVHPKNIRMLAIAIRIYCKQGNGAKAAKYFTNLPEVGGHRRRLEKRCRQMGVDVSLKKAY